MRTVGLVAQTADGVFSGTLSHTLQRSVLASRATSGCTRWTYWPSKTRNQVYLQIFGRCRMNAWSRTPPLQCGSQRCKTDGRWLRAVELLAETADGVCSGTLSHTLQQGDQSLHAVNFLAQMAVR